ncbi:InlB B-repeat-containing protein, partial [Faecalicoccus acidiformans]|uniref:InlB B-repeat-containing protein n=1 Tax=Faecalicoccus acidiformans TaxID=915173 RepID=UPI0025A44478
MSKHWKRFAAVVVSLTMAFQFCVNDFYAYAETNAPEQETVEQTPPEQQTQPEPEVTTEPVETPAQTEPVQEPAPEVETETTTPPVQEQPQQPAQEETPAQPEREVAGTLKLEFKDEEGNTLKTVDPIALTNKYVGDTIRLTDLGVDTNVADYTLVDIKDKNDSTKDYNANSVEFTLTKNVTELQLVYRANPKEEETKPAEGNNTNTTEDSQQGEEDSEDDSEEADTKDEETEEPVEEEPKEEVDMPEMTLSAVASDGAIVTVMVPEGSLPEGSSVQVESVESDSVARTVEAVLNEENQTLTDYKAYDITILDKDGNEIQPEKNVQVSITGAQVSGETKSIFHIDDSQVVEKISETTVANTSMFSASGFSIYAIAGSNFTSTEHSEGYTLDGKTVSLSIRETITLKCTDDHSWGWGEDHNWKTTNSGIVRLGRNTTTGEITIEAVSEGTTRVYCHDSDNYVDITVTAEGTHTVYIYSLIPGKNLNSPGKPDEIWNGMGVGTVSGVNKPGSYANSTNIPAGSYTFTAPSSYPDMTIDGKTYTYDSDGNQLPGTYSIEIIRLVTADGANGGNNGVNPLVANGIATFHLDTRLVIHDTERVQVGFHIKDAGEDDFELDRLTNGYYDVNTSETEIKKPTVQQTITLSDGTKWKFSGWFKDEQCTIPADFTGILTKNQDYYGKYIEVGEYTVTYLDGQKLFDGDFVNPETYNISEGYVVKGNNEIHDNSEKHVLIGWVTEKGKEEFLNGQGTNIINDRETYEKIQESEYFRAFGETYKEDGIKDGDNIKLYAVWAMDTIVEQSITIKYDGNGYTDGEVPVDSNMYYADSEVTVMDEGNLEKKGFTFEGWTLEKDGEEVVEATIDLSTIESIQNGATTLTLYAKWEEKEGTIGYSLTGGHWKGDIPEELVESSNKKYVYPYKFSNGDTITVIDDIPEKDNSVFIGWHQHEGGYNENKVVHAGDKVAYPYNNDSTYTLNAIWGSLDVDGYNDVYDGEEHSISSENIILSSSEEFGEAALSMVHVTSTVYSYSTDGGETYSEPTSEKPSFKDVGNYKVKVTKIVTVDGVEGTTEISGVADVIITPA